MQRKLTPMRCLWVLGLVFAAAGPCAAEEGLIRELFDFEGSDLSPVYGATSPAVSESVEESDDVASTIELDEPASGEQGGEGETSPDSAASDGPVEEPATDDASPGSDLPGDVDEGLAPSVDADGSEMLLFLSEFDARFVGPPIGAKASRDVLRLLDQEVLPGERKSLSWTISESFSGESLSTPVIVVHGSSPGPRLCLTAAVHGDELNGVEMVRRVMAGLDESRLAGVVIGVPIVNLFGFSRGSRYLPDRRDLNRYFPGSPTGSVASRIAYSLFNGVLSACDALVDIHTGSFDRTNLPQIRGDLTIPSVLELTRSFGATAVLHTPGDRGMLRRAATDREIPAVTFEVGSPLRLEPEEIAQGVAAIQTLMQRMGMTPRRRNVRNEPQPIYYESRWIRATGGGMLFSDVKLGDRVRPGQRLGNIIDPLRDNQRDIVSPVRGRVIGMAQNQVVLPGFAAYHIGVETSEEQVVEEAQSQRSLEMDGPPPEHDRMESAPDDPPEDESYGSDFSDDVDADEGDGEEQPSLTSGEAA